MMKNVFLATVTVVTLGLWSCTKDKTFLEKELSAAHKKLENEHHLILQQDEMIKKEDQLK